MGLFVSGLNHRTAPVALREQLAVEEDKLRELLRDVQATGVVGEVVIVSTCNRVEVYGVGGNGEATALAQSPLKAHAARVEVSGETVFFYTQNAKELLAALAATPQLRTLHRPANLEDLFLKMTGRQIRGDG